MRDDILGTLLATVAAIPLFLTPGYAIAWTTNLFGFRELQLRTQLSWAVPASLAASPILAYLAARFIGLGFAEFLSLLSCAGVACTFLRRKSWQPSWKFTRLLVMIVIAWTIFVLTMTIDFQHGRRLFFSTAMADLSYRISFTAAVLHNGVPATNPLYYPGASVHLRYYYLWYVLCAVLAKTAHVAPSQAFYSSIVWAGLGLLSITHLYATKFFHWTQAQRRTALPLLLISGADLIPALGNAVLQPSTNGDIEWWSVDPIDGWPDSLLWVPHHVASVICCLFAFLLLWLTRSTGPRDRLSAIGLAALACASSFGLSIYVALGFAMMTAAWVLWLAIRRQADALELLMKMSAILFFSSVLLIPLLLELLAPHSQQDINSSPSGSYFILSVRRFIDSGLLSGLPILAPVAQRHYFFLDQSIRLLLLLPGLAMELGLFGCVLLWIIRDRFKGDARPLDEEQKTSLFLAIAGLLLTLFISSSVISNNDFGYRAVMLPQFFWMLLATDLLGAWKHNQVSALAQFSQPRWRMAVVLIGLGAAGTACGAILLRGWLPSEVVWHPDHGYQQSPSDEYSIRAVFEDLDRKAPTTAVVAWQLINQDADRIGNEVMTPMEFFQRMLVMNTNRQIFNAESKCATHFGGSALRCQQMRIDNQYLYGQQKNQHYLPDKQKALQFCANYGVSYLLASYRDPFWYTGSGWMQDLPVATRQPGFVVYDCRSNQ